MSLLGRWLRIPAIAERRDYADMLADPKVRLPLAYRSGPLVVKLEYRVPSKNARAFHNLMQDVQLYGQGNGAYGGSIAHRRPRAVNRALNRRHDSIFAPTQPLHQSERALH
ncbi:MFS transporter [Bradyrhizobium sp. 145]|uniref:MFS transporter n=1 Tax=Bradyrhizobium sp. 145 TaxID=2782621 RepID=UPI001FF9ECDC|nr:MFS transporter [Bradyrhizobium sp. 145]MCK1688130.1 MFS transporter [Bradyrhizobium sp. 145]